MANKINSRDELTKAKEEILKATDLSINNPDREVKKHILVCAGGGCVACGSLKLSKELKSIIKEKGLDREVKVIETGCLGPCVKGPVIVIEPDNVFYQRVQISDANEIIEKT